MMGLERMALPTSWGRIGPESLNLTVPTVLLSEVVGHILLMAVAPAS